MSNQKLERLKPCPVCGQLPRTEMSVVTMGGVEYQVDFSVHCPNCGTTKTMRVKINAYATYLDVDKAEEQVIEAWNRRVAE